MSIAKKISIWWGPPKDFDTRPKERRVSWLELFYDLVYVIAIARITHHLSVHPSTGSFLEYGAVFSLIFWGWLNGSLHHDLHGNQGLRTRLMMLWQMMIIAALAIELGRPEPDYAAMTIIFMIMQLFITYQWWSVGLYDKQHRKYSWPYTLFYLLAFGIMAASLWLPLKIVPYLLAIVLACNYAPPFVAHRLLAKSSMNLRLSSSMFERLGLFTIIIFGELVIGVVNGFDEAENLSFPKWIDFALGISVVFSLWWIFFTFISTRQVKKGLSKASLLELLYIPALIALGIVAVSLTSIIEANEAATVFRRLFVSGISAFLYCICIIMGLLVYPDVFRTLKKPMRISLFATASLFAALSVWPTERGTTTFMGVTLVVLVIEITFLNYVYYRKLLKEGLDPEDVKNENADQDDSASQAGS